MEGPLQMDSEVKVTKDRPIKGAQRASPTSAGGEELLPASFEEVADPERIHGSRDVTLPEIVVVVEKAPSLDMTISTSSATSCSSSSSACYCCSGGAPRSPRFAHSPSQQDPRPRRCIFGNYWSSAEAAGSVGLVNAKSPRAATGRSSATSPSVRATPTTAAAAIPSSVQIPSAMPGTRQLYSSPVTSFDEREQRAPASPCSSLCGTPVPDSPSSSSRSILLPDRRQREQQQLWPSYGGKYLFSPTPSPHMIASGAGRGRQPSLHEPPELSLTPKPRSILRRRVSDHASDRARGSGSPRSPHAAVATTTASSAHILPKEASISSLRRAQSDSLRAIDNLRTCIYGNGRSSNEPSIQQLPVPLPQLVCSGNEGGGGLEEEEEQDDGGIAVSGSGSDEELPQNYSAALTQEAYSRDEPLLISPSSYCRSAIAVGSSSSYSNCERRSSIDSPERHGGHKEALGVIPCFSPRPGVRGGSFLPSSLPPPPLFSLDDCISDSNSDKGNEDGMLQQPQEQRCSVRFDPRVSVREFLSMDDGMNTNTGNSASKGGIGRSNKDSNADPTEPPNNFWFTANELEQFKREAIILAQKFYLLSSVHAAERLRDEPELRSGSSGEGTCRMESQQKQQGPQRKALFANPALRATEEDRIIFEGSRELYLLLVTHVRNIMVVDPHDVFLDLFYRYIKKMMPHTNVVTFKSGEDALRSFRRGVSASDRRGGVLGRSDSGAGSGCWAGCSNTPTYGGGRGQRNKNRHGEGWDAETAPLYEGFDIIIVEERLHQCQLSRLSSDESLSSYEGEFEQSPLSQLRTPLSPFLHQTKRSRGQSAGDDQYQSRHPQGKSHNQRLPMSGSQLLFHIGNSQRAEKRAQRSQHDGWDASGASYSPFVPRQLATAQDAAQSPLLIGVSGWLGEDCEKLRRGGADMLWGKPPPIMDSHLRNELLTALLAKRGHPIFICD